MQCPFCETENREDRERCYYCDKDISMLRLVTNKARHHYNVALEHAERGRLNEAKDELHNALDLDRRFVNAHVVLGTLYAKQGDFDRARQAWNDALALQPELAKSHGYLQRVQTVEKTLPALRRFRIAGAILLAVALVLGLSLLLVAREPASLRYVQQAQTALAARQYGRALDLLESAQDASRPGSLPHTAATTLLNALQAEMRAEVHHIQELKYREEYPRVLSAIADLEARRPDEVTSAALVNIREDVNHYYLGQLRRLFGQFEAGEGSYADFVQQAREFFQAYPEIPEKRDIAAYMERAAELEAARRIGDLRQEYETTAEPEPVIEGLRRLASELGESPAVAEGRAQLVDYLLSTMFDEFHLLVEEQNFAGADEQLRRIAAISEEFRDVVDVRGPLELAAGVLTDVWTGARLKEAEQLVRGGEPEEAFEALSLLRSEADTLSTSARDLILDLEEELDRRVLERDLAQLRSLAPDLLKGELKDAASTETVELAERLARRLPEAATRAEVLAYGAAAASAGGARERAAELAERARSEGSLDPKLAEDLQKLLKRRTGELQRRPEKAPAKRTSPEKKESSKPKSRQEKS